MNKKPIKIKELSIQKPGNTAHEHCHYKYLKTRNIKSFECSERNKRVLLQPWSLFFRVDDIDSMQGFLSWTNLGPTTHKRQNIPTDNFLNSDS